MSRIDSAPVTFLITDVSGMLTGSVLQPPVPSPQEARLIQTVRHREQNSAERRDAYEADLFTRFFDGDDGAFGELFDRHMHRLYLFALKFLGEQQGAEDVVQDVWEKLIRMRGEGMEMPDNPMGYVVTMIRNLSLNRVRDRKVHASLQDVGEIELPAQPPREMSHAEELVVKAMPHLPDAYREVLVLNAYSGYRFDEIAQMLGEPVGAVRTRAWRARAQLARIISAYMELDDINKNTPGSEDSDMIGEGDQEE